VHSIPVHCIPERVLLLVSHYSEELELGTLEDCHARLRDTSRHKSSVPCLQWWKLLLSPGQCRFVPMPTPTRCWLKPTPGSSVHFAFCDSGASCMLSPNYIGWCLHGRIGGPDGPGGPDDSSTLWIWNQAAPRRRNTDWQCMATVTSGDRITSVYNPQTCHEVIAANSRYMLGVRLVSFNFEHVVMELSPPHSLGSAFPPCSSTHGNERLLAACFADTETPDYLFVDHDFVLRSSCLSAPLGSLVPLAGAAVNHRLALHSWSSSVVREGRSQYVFAFRVTFSLAAEPDPATFFHLVRFSLSGHGLTIMASWASHPIHPSSFSLRPHLRTDCTLDIVPHTSSLLVCQYEGSQDYRLPTVVTFDRRTLAGYPSSLNVTPGGSALNLPFRYTRVLSRFAPRAQLQVIIEGIRRSKEKRRKLAAAF
jgi:hypothetical protein